MTDPAFDRAIDDAARRLTAQAPPADLPARVMSRIHERARPHAMWRFAPLAAGVAAMAVIGIVWTFARTARHARGPATLPAIAAVAPSPAPVRPAPGASSVVSDAQPAPASPQTKQAAGPSAAELAWLERAVPALPRPAALNVEGIQPEALTIPQIDVKPLVTERLVLSPADGGGLER